MNTKSRIPRGLRKENLHPSQHYRMFMRKPKETIFTRMWASLKEAFTVEINFLG